EIIEHGDDTFGLREQVDDPLPLRGVRNAASNPHDPPLTVDGEIREAPGRREDLVQALLDLTITYRSLGSDRFAGLDQSLGRRLRGRVLRQQDDGEQQRRGRKWHLEIL